MITKFLLTLWNDEEGAETVEWVIIAAIVAAIAVVSYQGTLATAISSGMTGIEGTISSTTP